LGYSLLKELKIFNGLFYFVAFCSAFVFRGYNKLPAVLYGRFWEFTESFIYLI